MVGRYLPLIRPKEWHKRGKVAMLALDEQRARTMEMQGRVSYLSPRRPACGLP